MWMDGGVIHLTLSGVFYIDNCGTPPHSVVLIFCAKRESCINIYHECMSVFGAGLSVN